jgi:hypothetical protein
MQEGVDLSRLLPEVGVALIFAAFCTGLIRISRDILKDERGSRTAIETKHEEEWSKTVETTAVRFENMAREERESREKGLKAITKELRAIGKVIAKGDKQTASVIRRTNRTNRKGA